MMTPNDADFITRGAKLAGPTSLFFLGVALLFPPRDAARDTLSYAPLGSILCTRLHILGLFSWQNRSKGVRAILLMVQRYTSFMGGAGTMPDANFTRKDLRSAWVLGAGVVKRSGARRG